MNEKNNDDVHKFTIYYANKSKGLYSFTFFHHHHSFPDNKVLQPYFWGRVLFKILIHLRRGTQTPCWLVILIWVL